ncbi:MAG: hypothetical protein NT080_08505 [Spirochaetes bacterium]|nr:hypothetical protein [Spirochaetota bacterium]
MKTTTTAFFGTLFMFCAIAVTAWDDHAELTWLSLVDEPRVAETIAAESFDAFLEAEKAGLKPVLDAIEAKAAKNLDWYLPPPANLAFSGDSSGSELRTAFLRAIRVNPGMPLPLFVQLPPNAKHKGRLLLEMRKASLYDIRLPNAPFEALVPGGKTTVMETLMTASDEPDYGLDVGLFEDNGTGFGKEYGFGIQPFGNPNLPYGSQAPFHMAFPREDPIIKLAAPFTTRTYPAYRVMQFEALSRFAFSKGHAYWGYRFAGWALHYIQDMSYPYHASLLPGRSTFSILWLNLTGPKADKDAAVTLLSNRHLMGEDYIYRAVAADPSPDSPLAMALRKPEPGFPVEPYRELYVYDVAATQAYSLGRELDRLVAGAFASRYISDPSVDYGVDSEGYDPLEDLAKKPEGDAAAFRSMCRTMLSFVGVHTRQFVAYVRDSSAILPPRKTVFDPRGMVYIAVVAAMLALILVAVLRPRKRRLSR